MRRYNVEVTRAETGEEEPFLYIDFTRLSNLAVNLKVGDDMVIHRIEDASMDEI
jgi:hypothetical protein